MKFDRKQSETESLEVKEIGMLDRKKERKKERGKERKRKEEKKKEGK